MTRFVIDPAALLELARRDSQPPGHQLVGPASLRSQAMSLLYRRRVAGEVTEADIRPILERITTIKIRLLGDRVSRGTAWKLADALDLDDTLDAEYLAVTKLQADAFIALDPRMRSLAEGVVPTAEFDRLDDDEHL